MDLVRGALSDGLPPASPPRGCPTHSMFYMKGRTNSLRESRRSWRGYPAPLPGLRPRSIRLTNRRSYWGTLSSLAYFFLALAPPRPPRGLYEACASLAALPFFVPSPDGSIQTGTQGTYNPRALPSGPSFFAARSLSDQRG